VTDGRIPGIPRVLTQVGIRPKVPKPPRPTIFPSGPKGLGLERKPVIVGGPGEPFPGFLGQNNSLSEWPPYWALTKIKGPEGEASGWWYQKSESGGRHLPGGSVLDFSIEDQYPMIALRCQTERFHVGVSSQKRAYDREQLIFLSQQGYRVVDIYDYQYLGDETGQAIIKLIWAVLNGQQQPDPGLSGSVSVRPA
jgi:hypothetical protein